MSLSEATTSAFLSGVLKGAEECLGFLKGSLLESTPHEYPPPHPPPPHLLLQRSVTAAPVCFSSFTLYILYALYKVFAQFSNKLIGAKKTAIHRKLTRPACIFQLRCGLTACYRQHQPDFKIYVDNASSVCCKFGCSYFLCQKRETDVIM